MPFEPEKITAAHVLQAVQKIKRETIALAPSTGYDVIVEEEAYPPKEIMRYAHEQMNGELMWDKSGGLPTNQILEKLGFEIRSKPVNNQGTQSSGSSQIWKLGCLWDSGKPSFYEYIKEQQIVIGVSNKEYDASDLIVITEGYQVKAIALVLETPKPVTSNPDLQSGFKKYEIEYSESTLFAQAEWYELAQEERFQYRLQQGISKVQDIEIQNTARKLWNERHASFWVFQGNPKVYDFEGAMKEGVLQDWTVSAHKHRIEENDRAIIWITGKRSGCYALARVASSPKEKKEPSDDHLWKSEKKPPFSAEIEILTNLVETPILKAVVDSTPGLQNLKVGKQGTNFSATRNEYRILEKLAHSAMKNKPENQKVWPMNMILYGPPGTGKTYSTIDLAAKIIGFDTGSHAENLKAFNERIGKNIEFVTFHQSFTYEDFIEGIKPQTSETKDRGKQVTYEVQDGVFKKMAKRARKANLSIKTEESQVKFERAFDELKNELAASENDEIEIPMKRVSYHITGISSDYIKFRKSSGGTGHDLKVDVLRKMYTGDLQYAQEGLGIYYYPLVDYLKSKSEQAPETEEEKTEETHVLIIDEINRGNVAAIFGELITLIEEDKRAGGKNPISTTLPYSKTEFAVPSNLYLIGTMNTADRSVEALDTALRRRFSFTEVGPEPKLLSPKAMILSLLNRETYADLGWEEEPYHSHARKLYDFLGVAPDSVEAPLRERAEVGEGYWEKADLEHLSPDDFTGVQLDKLLRTINLRIARLIDRDHMIGHAYFMGIATAPDPWQALKEVFHRNILPLLQEYFFGDYAKIGLVLGSGFVGVEEAREGDVFADFPYEASADLATQTQYTLKDVSKMSMPDFREAVWKISPDSNADKDG
ncbi:McrB family protein [Phaeodactylibacter xiamenensis]|uniref:McrB family protein n=1 Tax=Phaeodactylibacter xiamenensis TaxID=1524460 RepID=UPI0024A97253|nr:AAA family ATPase [Phaeodactylibacter xiamenensis]